MEGTLVNKRFGWTCAALQLALLSGCAGGLHHRGQHQLSLTGSFGTAIHGDVGWPDGRGNADNAGATLGYAYFATDRLALLADLTPYRNYNQSDGDTFASELQLGLRYYVCEFEVADIPVGLYAEALGGLLYGRRSIPEYGAHGNFTQNTGVGVEVQFTPNVSWISGYNLRHLSHGHLFGDDPNPSQNDHFVYTGLAISLN